MCVDVVADVGVGTGALTLRSVGLGRVLRLCSSEMRLRNGPQARAQMLWAVIPLRVLAGGLLQMQLPLSVARMALLLQLNLVRRLTVVLAFLWLTRLSILQVLEFRRNMMSTYCMFVVLLMAGVGFRGLWLVSLARVLEPRWVMLVAYLLNGFLHVALPLAVRRRVLFVVARQVVRLCSVCLGEIGVLVLANRLCFRTSRLSLWRLTRQVQCRRRFSGLLGYIASASALVRMSACFVFVLVGLGVGR